MLSFFLGLVVRGQFGRGRRGGGRLGQTGSDETQKNDEEINVNPDSCPAAVNETRRAHDSTPRSQQSHSIFRIFQIFPVHFIFLFLYNFET